MKTQNSGYHHILPYIVFLGCLVLGAGATLMLLNMGRHTSAPNAIAPPKKAEPKAAAPEVVVGCLLPEKSKLASVGGDTPLQAVIYGRESDLLKVIGNPKVALTVDFGDAVKAQGSQDAVAILTHLRESQSAAAPVLANPPLPGHVVIVISDASQFLELTTLIRMDAKKTPDQRTISSSAPDPGCQEEGTTCIDSKGVISVSMGCVDGVEVEISSAGEFKVTIPEGGTRFSVSSKG